eukprot:c24538_g1_i1 orf=526-1275(+)
MDLGCMSRKLLPPFLDFMFQRSSKGVLTASDHRECKEIVKSPNLTNRKGEHMQLQNMSRNFLMANNDLPDKACNDTRRRSVWNQNLTAEKKELLKVFNTFDENGDGRLSKEEITKSLEKLGISMSQDSLTSLIYGAYTREDGFVHFDGFINLYESLCQQNPIDLEINDCPQCEDANLLEAFQVFDKDSDGFISAQELQSVFCSLGIREGRKLADCMNMIQRVDSDGDGQVDFIEFKQMMINGFRAKLET